MAHHKMTSSELLHAFLQSLRNDGCVFAVDDLVLIAILRDSVEEHITTLYVTEGRMSDLTLAAEQLDAAFDMVLEEEGGA